MTTSATRSRIWRFRWLLQLTGVQGGGLKAALGMELGPTGGSGMEVHVGPNGLGGPAGRNGLEVHVKPNGLGGPTGGNPWGIDDGVQTWGRGRNHLPALPQGAPTSFQPPEPQRLFTTEQHQQLEHLQRQAPQLYGTRGMQDETTSMAEKSYQQHLQTEADRLHIQWQLEREKEEMLKYMKALHQQNEELKIQLSEERDQRYTTPESVREVQTLDGRVKGGMSTLFGDRVEGELQAQHSRPADGGFRRSLQEHGVPGNARSITPPSRRRSRSPPGGKQSHQHAPSGQDSMVQTMLKIMEGMQSMQQQILEQSSGKRASGEGHRDDEYVRGSVELHKLAEWAPESAPVDFQDWLLVLQPQMADLSASSGEWWTMIMEVAKDWYRRHQELTALERLQHEVKVPQELTVTKWASVEKRACSLLLQAIPESQKEDIIASRSLTMLGIIMRLMVNYQPGGAHEKAAVLLALEAPTEAQAVGDAISGLRRWLRWKRRAVDINVSLPDPMVLLKGLDRLVSKVLAGNPTVQFRINLVRTTLKVDSLPTLTSVQLAESMMAELDQLAYSRRKEKGASGSQEIAKPKVKKLEEVKIEDPGTKGLGKGGKVERPHYADSSSRMMVAARAKPASSARSEGRSQEMLDMRIASAYEQCLPSGGEQPQQDHISRTEGGKGRPGCRVR